MTKKSGKIRLGMFLLLGVLAVVAFVVLTFVFGHVSGEEFSPEKFIIRRFVYWQVPVINLQVWPVSFTKVSGNEDALAKHIRMNRLNGDVSLEPPKWDIVSMNQVGRATKRGDASILTSYLQQPQGAGMESWLTWSTDHPHLAAELWPLVARLAHEDLYPVVATLLEATRGLAPERFDTELREIAARDCRSIAVAHRTAGQVERADSLESLAIAIEAGAHSSTLSDTHADGPAVTAEADPVEAEATP